MRIIAIFLLFAVVVFYTQGDEDKDENSSESESDSGSQEEEGKEIKLDCEQYKQNTCPKNGNPVCGTDNKKYASECDLCLENRKKKKNIEILKYEEC